MLRRSLQESIIAFVLLMAAVIPLHAEEVSADALQLFSGEDEQVVSTSRIPRPVSRIAENVTVITADDIARLNAHTLADVLNTIPGIQLDKQGRTPGTFTFFLIQGAQNNLVQVLIDGVPQEELAEAQSDLGLMPVQKIERVEIVKGAASAAWGSALGGVVNVITKSPEPDKHLSGTVSASAGEHFTTDLRGEASGTVKNLGYYLTGGNLHSDGLLPSSRTNHNYAYGKLVYTLPVKGTVTFGFDYSDAFRGYGEVPPPADIRDTNETKFIYSFLTVSYPIADRLSLEVTARHSGKDIDNRQGFMTSSDLWKGLKAENSVWGTGARLFWGDSLNNVVFGIDYEHDKVRQSEPVRAFPENNFDRAYDKYGTFANGSFTIGRITLLPGIRFDHTGISGDYLSATMGATFLLTEKSVLRAYAARGYSQPKAIFPNHSLQTVYTVQTGAETGEIPGIWLKGTLFYNLMKDVEAFDSSGVLTDQIRQGVEVEVRTVPVFGFSLAGGYTFTDLWEKSSHSRIEGTPAQLGKISLRYDNDDIGLRGVLSGNYVDWDTLEGSRSKGSNILWDMSVTKSFAYGNYSPEVFFSLYNLFNVSQYQSSWFRNAPRWIEGGVRFKF